MITAVMGIILGVLLHSCFSMFRYLMMLHHGLTILSDPTVKCQVKTSASFTKTSLQASQDYTIFMLAWLPLLVGSGMNLVWMWWLLLIQQQETLSNVYMWVTAVVTSGLITINYTKNYSHTWTKTWINHLVLARNGVMLNQLARRMVEIERIITDAFLNTTEKSELMSELATIRQVIDRINLQGRRVALRN